MNWIFFVSIPFILYILYYTLRRFFAGGKCPTKYFKNVKGKTFFITGGNRGIGFETAKYFVKQGAKRVIIACRNKVRARKAVETLKKLNVQGDCEVRSMIVDLSALKSVKSCCDKILHEYNNNDNIKIDVFLMNAGAMKMSNETTNDGVEFHYGTNFLGHFFMIQNLYKYFIQNSSRVILISSTSKDMISSQSLQKVKRFMCNKEKIFSPMFGVSGFALYTLSKIAMIYLAQELQSKFHNERKKTLAKAYSLHPGGVITNIISGQSKLFKIILTIFTPILSLVMKSLWEGIQTHLFLSLAPLDVLKEGAFYVDCKVSKDNHIFIRDKLNEKVWKTASFAVNVIRKNKKI